LRKVTASEVEKTAPMFFTTITQLWRSTFGAMIAISPRANLSSEESFDEPDKRRQTWSKQARLPQKIPTKHLRYLAGDANK
jgi:hypothetical protein